MRLPVAEGTVCYGSGEGNQAVFIRTDQWLPKSALKKIPSPKAQSELLRKFLRAYGPATLHDFAHWSGISMQEVRPLRPLVEADLEELACEVSGSILLREDVSALRKCSASESCVRLLPTFDSYLLAHRQKDHLLTPANYKRVYRNQGWISPVVLVNGSIAGVWSHKLKNKKLMVEVDPSANSVVTSALPSSGKRGRWRNFSRVLSNSSFPDRSKTAATTSAEPASICICSRAI